VQERHHFGLGEERDHQQRVQVQPLAEHPKVSGHQKVLDENVQQFAAQLKISIFSWFERDKDVNDHKLLFSDL